VTSSDALPVEPLIMDCAADALAALAADTVSAAVLAAAAGVEALEALEIVDIEMLRTSVLLSSLGEKRT